MVVVKSENADTFLSRPSSEISLVLIYGADAGFVSERLRMAIKGKILFNWFAWMGVISHPIQID